MGSGSARRRWLRGSAVTGRSPRASPFSLPGTAAPLLTLADNSRMPALSAATAGSALAFELHQERGERVAEAFDARLLLGVLQGPVRLERLVRLGDGELVRQDDHADVAEDRPDVDQPSQTSQGAGRSTHQRGDF